MYYYLTFLFRALISLIGGISAFYKICSTWYSQVLLSITARRYFAITMELFSLAVNKCVMDDLNSRQMLISPHEIFMVNTFSFLLDHVNI
jgi:hypothetical protein